MSLLNAQMKTLVVVVESVKGIPMTDSVSPCSMWFDMLFPCTLTGDTINFVAIRSIRTRLIPMELVAGMDFSKEKTKRLFRGYMYATGELYRGYTYERI